jgi:hypothetical protein
MGSSRKRMGGWAQGWESSLVVFGGAPEEEVGLTSRMQG